MGGYGKEFLFPLLEIRGLYYRLWDILLVYTILYYKFRRDRGVQAIFAL